MQVGILGSGLMGGKLGTIFARLLRADKMSNEEQGTSNFEARKSVDKKAELGSRRAKARQQNRRSSWGVSSHERFGRSRAAGLPEDGTLCRGNGALVRNVLPDVCKRGRKEVTGRG